MSNQYRLVGVGNAELVAGLSKLVQQSNSLTAQVLAHLVELEERQLHLELGFSSLFAYCVESLGMSEGTAGRRVTAARVCRRFPEVFDRVARGELHLCALCALAPHLNEQNAVELFELGKGKTRRQIEELLAARFPRPDVREQIRRLPARDQRRDAGEARTGEDIATAAGPMKPIIAADSTLPRAEPTVTDVRPRSRGLEPLSAGRFGVHFTADAELRELIERARRLASHRVPNGDLAALMKLMVASFVKREEKRRFGVESKPLAGSEATHSRGAESATPPGGASVSSCTSDGTARAEHPKPPARSTHSRYLRVKVRHEIHARDGGQCTFVSADGRRCDARAFIEFDHVEPFAWNGSSDAPNLRLLCKAHNLLHARTCFGNEHIAAKLSGRSRTDWERRPK